MHTVTLRTVGGSVMFAIPKPLLEGLGLAPNTEVGVSIESGRLVVVPQSRPRYRLAELLAECDPEAPQDARPLSGPGKGRWAARPCNGARRDLARESQSHLGA